MKTEISSDEGMKFAYEKLEVWNKAVNFAVQVIDAVGKDELDRKHYRLVEQIEASSASVAANIAEGKGRISRKEFVRFLYISRGSLYETMTFLEIYKRKGWIEEADFNRIENLGIEVASMIKGLINSISND